MQAPKRTVVFIASLLSQPRCIKRVTSFLNAGYRCIVYGYDRGVYDVNCYPEGVEIHKLGTLDNGEYLNKFKTVNNDVSFIVGRHKSHVLYYSFGFAPALMLSFKKVKFVYELSDVWYAYPRFNKIRFLLKFVDKRIISKSALTLMTSGGFCNFFKETGQKILLQPNRISPYFLNKNRTIKEINYNLSFGFVGSIRYKNIFRFAEVIGKHYPNYSFNFYGGGDKDTLNKIQDLISSYTNVRYWGKFKSPEDLEQIYSNLDIVVACYDNNSINERIAEPNKLYEALFFAKPIIVSQGIYLSERVKELACGYTLDASSIDNIKAFIDNLSIDSVRCISEHESTIPLDQIIDNSNLLINRISEIFNSIKDND